MIKRIFRIVIVGLLLVVAPIGVTNALTCADLEGASLYSREASPIYLGFFGSVYGAESINNAYGNYGSAYGSYSVRNPYGAYGSEYNTFSATNPYTFYPPAILKHGVVIGSLTANGSIAGGVSLPAVDASCSFASAAPYGQWPAVPMGVVASDGYVGAIEIAWLPALGANSYDVYRSVTSNSADAIYAGTVTTSGAVDSGVVLNQVYYYWVVACNSYGCSLAGPGDSGYAVADNPNIPPVADAGPDQQVEDADRSGAEQVTLNGSGSSDPDGSITSFQWLENGNQIATGQRPQVTLGLGSHVITLKVTDNDGDTASDNVLIEVTEPPIPIPDPVPLLLRRSTDNKWFTYMLGGDGVVDKGFLTMTRSPALGVVSRADFDGDGKPDLMLRDLTDTRDENGRWFLYTLDGLTVNSQGFMDTLTRNSDWELLSSDDFNGDDNADLLLRNKIDGRWLMYLLDGRTILGQGAVAMSSASDDVFQGAGDFNGDGSSDVLLRRADGSWLMYMLDGLTVISSGAPALTTSQQFTMQSLADFDGDSKTDVLLRRADGRWFMYMLNGLTVSAQGSPAMTEVPAFELQSVTDFNGDGKADVLVRRATDGRWFLYTLNGTAVLDSGSPDMTQNLAFQVVSTEDYTGDGNGDVLMRRTDGRWVMYAMSGPQVVKKIVSDMTGNLDWIPYPR